LAFGLVFEFPVVLLILAKIGVIDARTMVRYRRYAILLIFIFSAVMTPPDLISQLLMALPLMALYELSILLAKLFGKRPNPTSAGSEVSKEAVSTSP